MLKPMANLMLGMAETLAEFSDNKLVVEIDEHKMDLKFVDPDQFRNREAFYNDSHFVNGNIFIKGYANPIKPVFDRLINKTDELSEDEVRKKLKLKPCLNYKTFMRETKIKDMANVSWEDSNLLMTIIMILIIAGVFLVGMMII